MGGGLVTEAGARWYQKTNNDAGSPLTVLNWLMALKNGGKEEPFQEGVDRWGDDMAPCGADGCSDMSSSECKSLCESTGGCIAYVSAPSSCAEGGLDLCWLKQGAGGHVTERECRNSQVLAHALSPFIPGVMIDWEVMVGHSQTRWHWGDAEGIPEPPIPWHNHIYPDGTPVSFTEAAATRRYMTGKDEFIFVETFLDVDDPAATEQYLTLPPGQSFNSTGIAATEALYELTFWPEGNAQRMMSCDFIGENKDFVGSDVKKVVYEGSTDEEKDASCCAACEQEEQCEYWVRATDTNDCWLKNGFTGFSGNSKRRGPKMTPEGEILDQLSLQIASSYVIVIDSTHLRLDGPGGRLASFNVSQVEGGLVPRSWNLLRVLVQNERVRIWFNPQFSDVTGASVPPADEQSLKAMPPRIDVAIAAEPSGGDFLISTPNGNKGDVRVDYVSVLPPKLYGLAAEDVLRHVVAV